MIASQETSSTQTQLFGELEQILNPVGAEFFFAEHWNAKALYLPGPALRFAGLFNRQAFDRAMHDCFDLKVGYTDANGWPGHFNIEPQQATEMYAAGKTICATRVDQGNRMLQEFLARWSKNFAMVGSYFFNSYLSPEGAGFGLHIDTHAVWILQLEGHKKWKYSRFPGVRKVITNVSFPQDRDELKLPWGVIQRPEPEDMDEVFLSAGDVLYLPKGTWHEAKAVGGSLALTLAEPYFTPLHLLQIVMGKRFKNNVELLDALPVLRRSSVQVGMPASIEHDLSGALSSLREMVNSLTASELHTAWRSMQ